MAATGAPEFLQQLTAVPLGDSTFDKKAPSTKIVQSGVTSHIAILRSNISASQRQARVQANIG